MTGWRIDIKSEDEKRREVEAQFEGLEDGEESATLTLPGLDDTQLVRLSDAGLDTADRLLETSVSNLAQVAEVDEETAVKLQDAVREQVAAAEQAAAEIAERTEEANSANADEFEEKDNSIVASDEGDPTSIKTSNDLSESKASESDTDSKS